MAESFLEEIYKKSIIVEYLKETVEFTQKSLLAFAMRTWSEKILPGISDLSMEERSELPLKEMLSATESIKNPSLFSSIVENEVIPAFLNYLSRFNGIEVSENGYCLKSSNTGLLTLVEEASNIYFHSMHDPMWEAHILAHEVFDPTMSEYVFLGGVGLGYLPYQIFALSHESVKITILEVNKVVVDYGLNYGVLGWITEDNLSVLVGDESELFRVFLEMSVKKDVRCVITPYHDEEYITQKGHSVMQYMINRAPNDKYKDIYGINIRKNKDQKLLSAQVYSPPKKTDTWVVVAAGPSLDENIDFLTKDNDKKVIIAVNTVVRKLIRKGIKPDLIIAIDANDQLLEHIAGVEDELRDVPLLCHPLTNWKFVSAHNGEKYCFRTEETKEYDENWFSDYPLWDGCGVTVSDAAMEAAYYYGANTIYLVGLDLGYPEGKMYADGAAHTNSVMDTDGVMADSIDGKKVRTTKVFLQFKTGIERKIKQHAEIHVYNMSKHGAVIEGAVSWTGDNS